MQTCGDEEQGREGLQQAQAPSERRLSPHVSLGFDLLLWFDSRCFCGVVTRPDRGPFWFCFRRDNFRNVSNIKQVSMVSILVPFAPAPISLFLFELVMW